MQRARMSPVSVAEQQWAARGAHVSETQQDDAVSPETVAGVLGLLPVVDFSAVSVLTVQVNVII